MEKLIYLAMASPEFVLPLDGPGVVAAAREEFSSDRYRGVSVQLPRPDVEEERLRARGAVLQQAQAESAGSGSPAPAVAERLVAMLSLWVDCADDRIDADAFMAKLGSRLVAYSVTEAVPRWLLDGPGASPPELGVNAVTLMHRNVGMTHEQFLDHWYEVHMPMSLRMHPQWSYVRNVVVRSLTDETVPPDAIAEEGFVSPGDLIDPRRFYGAGDDDELFEANRALVHDDVPRFLDIARTSTHVTEEHVLRAAWTPARGHDPGESA